MHVNKLKWWIIKQLKIVSFCAISLETNHWHVHCFTSVQMAPDNINHCTQSCPNHCLQCMHKCILLTHWVQVTHICGSKLTIIGSDNGMSPGRHQAIIWTNDGILLIGPLGTNFSEILIEIYTFSFKKMHFKMSSGKWQPFCLGHNLTSSLVDSLVPRRFESNFKTSNFQADLSDWWLGYLSWNCPQVIIAGPHWWWVNIGSGNGWVPSGNKLLPEPVLTKTCLTLWHH